MVRAAPPPPMECPAIPIRLESTIMWPCRHAGWGPVSWSRVKEMSLDRPSATDAYPVSRPGQPAPVRPSAGAGGPHGRVRISAPVSVTTSVCSNWAVRFRSLVTTVQPSSHMSYSYVPSVSIGSMVKVIPGLISAV